MTQSIGRNSGYKIQVFPAVFTINIASFSFFHFKAGGELRGLSLVFKEILLHGAKIRKTAGWCVVFNLVKVLILDKVLSFYPLTFLFIVGGLIVCFRKLN